MTQSKKKVLLISNPELGQLNVHLSTAYALLTLEHNVTVHFASAATVEHIVAQLSDFALKSCSAGREPIYFHALQGPSSSDVFKTLPPGETIINKAGFWHMFPRIPSLLHLGCPWAGQDYIDAYDGVCQVLDMVKPDVVGVDPLFSPALSGVRIRKENFHLVSPNSLKEYYIGHELLWKLPAVSTGFTYPIPWCLMPANILYVLWMAFKVIRDPRLRSTRALFREKVGPEPPVILYPDIFDDHPADMKILCPMLPGMDFPMNSLPEFVKPCGPIMKPFEKIETADPELAAWLEKGPTIFINLGSHRLIDEQGAVEMATGLRLLLSEAETSAKQIGRSGLSRLQILWKLQHNGGAHSTLFPGTTAYETNKPGSRIHNILGEYMDTGRVRIVSWIIPEPVSVLDSGHVVCSVHHGGANSAIEAIYTGVRHVVLPAWADCYDWAARAEYLELGQQGNKKFAPEFNSEELGEALSAVILGPKSEIFRDKAVALSQICKKADPGREIVARVLLGEHEE